MSDEEWSELKASRIDAIRKSIETLREYGEPKIHNYRHGLLRGRINELKVIGVLSQSEAYELSSEVQRAHREALGLPPE